MFIKRLATALLLIPTLILAIIFLSPSSFLLLLSIAVGLAALEIAHLAGLRVYWGYAYSLFHVLLLIGFLLFDVSINFVLVIVALSVVIWCFSLWRLYRYQAGAELKLSQFNLLLIGLWLLIPTWVSIAWLQGVIAGGKGLLIYLFILVWVVDSGAYLIGKRWGRRQFVSRISPNKTYLGTFAGITFAMVIASIYSYFIYLSQPILWFLLLSLMTVLAAIIGDLFESMLKRITGRKDSGQLLPGHGGLLDRIDSLTAATPVFFLLVYII